jgi:anaerobic nitric oxide reductase transcription regulator
MTSDARERLLAYEWPGNVRELENVLSRAVLRAGWKRDADAPVVIDAVHLDLGAAPAALEASGAAHVAASAPLAARVDEFRRRVIEDAVRRNGGSWAAAARELGLHRANLHHLARRLGLKG